jgi:hypothetical protein
MADGKGDLPGAAAFTLIGTAGASVSTRRWRWLCVAVVAGVYAVSFFLPAETILSAPGAVYFWSIPAGFFQRLAAGTLTGDSLWGLVGWLPNPLLVVGMILVALRRGWSALGTGLLATACACVWLLDGNYTISTNGLVTLNVGYYAWLASMLLLSISGAMMMYAAAAERQPSPPDALRLPPPNSPVFAHFRDEPKPPVACNDNDPRYGR